MHDESWQTDAAEIFAETETSFRKRSTLHLIIGRYLTHDVSLSIKIPPVLGALSPRYFQRLLMAEKEISEWQKSSGGGEDERQQNIARWSKG